MGSDLDIRPLAQWALFALIAIVGLWRGAAPERACIASLLAMIVLDRAYHFISPDGWMWQRIDLGHLVIDSTGATLLFVIALNANRIYPICLAGLQLVALVAHIEQLISPAVSKPAYQVLMVLPSYLQMATLATGICLHIRRTRIRGAYPHWRST